MKILIIEDSRLARTELKQLLNDLDAEYHIEEAANILEAQDCMSKSEFDLLLLDIEMPGGTGFDLLDQTEQLPAVIFVTAYDQYALKSFNYGAVDYLLKPVTKERLTAAINKITLSNPLTRELSLDSQVFLKQNEKCFFVRLKDIYAFESIGNYTRVHLNQDRPMIYKSLANLENKLPSEHFFRANRGWIFNTGYVDKIHPSISNGLDVTMSNSLEIEISRRQAAKFKQFWSL